MRDTIRRFSSKAERHPVLADTSALIAIANTAHWNQFSSSVHITTTNVCRHELKLHVNPHSCPTNTPPSYSRNGYEADVVGPPYLLYILLDNDLLSRAEFCRSTIQMIRREGWTGYKTVKSAWAKIPVDCSNILGDKDRDIL